MKQQIIETISNTTINNQKVVQEAEQTLKTLSNNQNYCLILMEIVDDSTIPQEIRLASLIQLKLMVQRRWCEPISQKFRIISRDEKLQIKKALLTAMIRCEKVSALIRVYKSIVQLVIAYDCKNWMPIQEIKEALNNHADNINIILIFIDGVIMAFADRPNLNKSILQQFEKHILPLLYQIVIGEKKTITLISLTMKILERVYRTEMNAFMRQNTIVWMPLIKQIIDHDDPSISITKANQKGTIDYYFYKSKKYSTRIIAKIFQSHTYWTLHKSNEEFAKNWLTNCAPVLLQSLANALKKPNLPIIKFYNLKSFTFATNRNPELLAPFSEYLLYEVIPDTIKLVAEEQSLANSSPLDALKLDNDIIGTDGVPKPAAAHLWICIVDIGCTKQNGVLNQGPQLRKSLDWIYGKLSSQNSDLIEKETAIHLLYKSKNIYTRHQFMIQPIIQMIKKYVFPLVSNDVIMIKVRVIDIIEAYGELNFEQQVLKQIIQFLFKALVQKDKTMLNIKAASAFSAILRQKRVLQLVKPYLKDLLQSYIKLISDHQIENVVISLDQIIHHYGDQINPYAIDLITYLTSQFLKFQQESQNQVVQKNGDNRLSLAANACIVTIDQIISSNLSKQALAKVQPYIIQILQVTISDVNQEHIEQSIQLLSDYLLYSNTISNNMWFFYPVFLYFVLGQPQNYSTKQVPLINHKQKQIFDNINENYSKTNFDLAMNVIRNFIYKSPALALQQKDMYGTPMIQLIMKIFQQSLKEGNRQYNEILNCVALMSCILENTKCSAPYVSISWNIFAYSMTFLKNMKAKKMSYQLICVCLFSNTQQTLKKIEDQPHGIELFNNIMKISSTFKKQYQVSRIILGLSSIFIAKRSEQINNILPNLFIFLSKIIKKLYEIRKTKQTQNPDSQLSDDQQNYQQDQKQQYDDYWSQNKSKFRTNLDKVDATMYFEAAWNYLIKNSPQTSQKIKQTIKPQDAQQLQVNINNCKKMFISQRKQQPRH